MSANPVEVAVGIPFLFFLPGYLVTKAVFPEWRIRGPEATLRLIEVVSLGFVLSVVLTVLVGYALLGSPGGFAASWGDPVLESALGGIAIAAFVGGLARGAYRAQAPSSTREREDDGEEGAWELSRELDRLAREERRLEHSLRVAASAASDRASIEGELEAIRRERIALERGREETYER